MADLGTVIDDVTRVPTPWIQDVNDFVYRRFASKGTFVNVAEMLATAVPAGPAMFLLQGYFNAGDGGGTPCAWVSSSMAAVDNVLVFALTANGANPGRAIRLLPESGVIDVRYAGCVEGRTVNQNSDAFLACIVLMQTSGGTLSKLRCDGTFTFDGTRWNYNSNQQAINTTNAYLTIELGGSITFTNAASGNYTANTFFHPSFATVRGIGGDGIPSFSTGCKTQIFGNYTCRGSGSKIESVVISGTLKLEGQPLGTDASVQLNDVWALGAGGQPGLWIQNKYVINSDNSGFSTSGGTDAILIESGAQYSGTFRFSKGFIDSGRVRFNLNNSNSNYNFYFNFLSENLLGSEVFSIGGTGGASSNLIIDNITIADAGNPACQLIKVDAGSSFHGVRVNSTGGVLLSDPSLRQITSLDVDIVDWVFDNGNPDLDLRYKNNSSRVVSRNGSTFGPTWGTMNMAPGYVKPGFNVVRTTPTGGGIWTAVPAGAFDAVSGAYSKVVAVNDSVPILVSGDVSITLAVGEAFVCGVWLKRTGQVLISPDLHLNTTLGGVLQVDQFSGGTFVNNAAPLGRCSGYTDYYFAFIAFKATNAGAHTFDWTIGPIAEAGTLPMCAPYVAKISGDPTTWDAEQLARSNTWFPSLSGAASGSLTNYYSWAPAPHLFYTDTGFTPALRTLTMFPANVFGTGSGITANRPVAASGNFPKGLQWYDTTLNKPIWTKGDGTWLDATGAAA